MKQPYEPGWDRAVEALAPTPQQQHAAKQLVRASTAAPLAEGEVERLVDAAIAADRPRAPSRLARRAAVAGLLLVAGSIAARPGTIAWRHEPLSISAWSCQEAARQALIHPDETKRRHAVAVLEDYAAKAIEQLLAHGQAAAAVAGHLREAAAPRTTDAESRAAAETLPMVVLAMESAPLTTREAQAERDDLLRELRCRIGQLSESRPSAPAHPARR